MDDAGTPRSPRRFRLADAMILVAATAIALGWMRTSIERRLTFVDDGRVIENLRPSTLVGAALATTWSIAVLAIRLRPIGARDTDRKTPPGPGFVACVAATAGSLAKLTALFAWGVSVKFRFERWYVPSVLGQLTEPAAMAVAGAWLALWLVGSWRRERTWIDNLGIAVGVAWLALDAFAWAAICFD